MLHTLIQPLIDQFTSYWYAVQGLVGLVLTLLFVKFQIRIMDWIEDLLD